MCVSINGPVDPDLTGMWVAPKVGNLPFSNLGTIGLWIPKLFAMYATDKRMDGQK